MEACFHRSHVPWIPFVKGFGQWFKTDYTHQVDRLSPDEPIGARLSLNIRYKYSHLC